MTHKEADVLQDEVSGSEVYSPEESIQWTEEEERRLVRKYVNFESYALSILC
jgi:hypothetical protein